MRQRLNLKMVIVLLLVTVTGCDLETEINLGDGYYFIGNQGNTCISKAIPGKRGIYDDVIVGKIVSQSHDDKFIVVYREVNEESKIPFGDHPLWTETNNTPRHQFWIINKVDGTVDGPLDFTKYISLKKKKGINLTLEI